MKKHAELMRKMERIKGSLEGLASVTPDPGSIDTGEIDKFIDF